MKTIIYILIAVFIGSILISAIPMSSMNSKKNITLQCTDNNPNILKLDQSAKIIENRLNGFGIDNFNMTVSKNGLSINISFKNNDDFNRVQELLTHKGKLEFYETYDRKDIIEKLEKEDKLFSFLNIPLNNNQDKIISSNAILGYCNESNKSKVDDYISKSYVSSPNQGIKFIWSKFPIDENNWLLYLLNHSSAIQGADINKSIRDYNKITNSAEIMITFSKKGGELWQELTRNNIGKSIAIVLDSQVYYAPKVMSVIKNGKCVISGGFSKDEANQLVTIINYGELPLEFTLVE
ncbi:MAG: hypothetical protein KAT68_06590 [Bacteroidales bacterium]|nr:hypothetical protein [Bacteroidales bacterium]